VAKNTKAPPVEDQRGCEGRAVEYRVERVSAGAQAITGPTGVGMVVMVMVLHAARHDLTRVAGDRRRCQRICLDKSASTSAS
jgi:hypothetical protein